MSSPLHLTQYVDAGNGCSSILSWQLTHEHLSVVASHSPRSPGAHALQFLVSSSCP